MPNEKVFDMSNTYLREKQQKREQYTKWQLTYGVIASRLIRKGVHPSNAFPTAKFLGAFVYVFSPVYSWFKMLRMKSKVAKIKAKAK